MVKIESEPKVINRSDVSLFNFLGDFRNFDKLMPDKVVNWQSTENSCYFTISGLGNIGMEITEKIPYSKIRIRETKKAPFEFDFTLDLEKIEDLKTRVIFSINAEINPMLSMMVSKPLKNFLDMLVTKLGEIPI